MTRSLHLSIFILFCIASTHAQQFDRFRSKTQFDNNNPNNLQNVDMENENSDNDFNQNQQLNRAQPLANSNNQMTEPEDDDIQTFGRSSTPYSTPAKNSKYVNLNPETAFGPEIVNSFDFPDSDILEVTKHMQKLTGINLILDKDVKGKVSISAPTPITVGDAWKAYLTALNMAGYTLVKSGAFYKIINARDVRYTPTTIYTGNYTPDTENYLMKVVSLKHVDAAEITRNFRPFMSRYGRIIDIKQTNTVIIADTGSNINRLMKMIQFLDVPGFEEELQIIPVKHSSAQEIAKLLGEILQQNNSGARPRAGGPRPTPGATSSGSGANIGNLIAEPRTNSIIAMVNSTGAAQLRELIAKLDVPIQAQGAGKIHVYYLQHGNSEELSKTLAGIVSSAARGQGANNRRTQARPGTFAQDQGDSLFSEEVQVTSDKANNALVVTASPTDWLTLKQVIEKLDIPKDQVYVEGLILETSVQNNNEFGTSYVGAYGAGSAQRSGFGVGSGGLIDLMTGQFQNLSGFFTGFGVGNARQLRVPGTNETITVNSINGLIKAVVGSSNTNILATPQILATDNTEAIFEVGETVPITTQTTSQGGVTSNNVTQQNITLTLKITPQINRETDFVKMIMDLKSEDFNADRNIESGAGGAPTTLRAAKTEVIVKNTDTIAMGGLMRNKLTESEAKIPLLGDIPVLGWLFKNRRKENAKVSLLLFLTPKIISPYAPIASQNTEELIDKRNKAVKEILKDEDPYREKMDQLLDKVRAQAKPMAKATATEQNLESSSVTFEQMGEIPNYEEILKEAEKQ